MQPSQQDVAPSVKGVEWELSPGGLRIVTVFWAGIPVSSAWTVEPTQKAGIVPRRRCATIGITF